MGTSVSTAAKSCSKPVPFAGKEAGSPIIAVLLIAMERVLTD
jgi:hypothetical protein